MEAPDRVAAWRPRTTGVAEVLHAAWHDHAYPAHTHDTWTVLIVDDGLIGYGLDRHQHSAAGSAVTVLPPHVPHDGRTVTTGGFRKRVVYLDEDVLGARLVGPAVDAPLVPDRALRRQVSLLDRALVTGEDLEAESRLALVVERLRWHLRGRPDLRTTPAGPSVARLTRDILDADLVATPPLAEIAARLGVGETHVVRAFTRAYGLPPHRYVVGRRLDLARRLLLDGRPAAEVATETGFYDQAHLTRHFKRLVGVTPGRYRTSPAPR